MYLLAFSDFNCTVFGCCISPVFGQVDIPFVSEPSEAEQSFVNVLACFTDDPHLEMLKTDKK